MAIRKTTRTAAAPRSTNSDARSRCSWTGDDPLMVRYHDTEWGVPVHDDRSLFEFLTLEGAQAGLSWRTILHKRAAYKLAFDEFEVARVARYSQKRIAALMLDSGIVRNRLKIEATVQNARAFLTVQQEFGSFSNYQWRFVGGSPVQTEPHTRHEVPSRTPISDAFSKDLKQRGFKFVGTTIMYAHMQAVGMVNDHLVECFRRKQLAPKPARSTRAKAPRSR